MSAPSAQQAFPTVRLLLATAITSVILLAAATLAKVGAEWSASFYQSVALGLASASLAHLGGILAGGYLASVQRGATGPMTAYLASTVVRFIGAPTLALSLYFALPTEPKPLLIGAGAGYLLILVVDLATMLKVMSGGAGSSSTPSA
jgi:hypothetical protein